MAAHYDTAILPARPRDKAKVEVAVLIIERWLLGRLRHRRFYSLAELNTTIGELLRQLNDDRPIGGSVSPAGRCSKSLTGPTSTRCRRSPIALPSGAFAGSASITMSSSMAISIASLTALPAARWRCG
jgi:hypothetical protein